jgi:transposase
MFMVGKIRRMHFRDSMSVREIVRRTGLSRNTVRTWLRAPKGKEPRYRRTAQAGKLTPFQAVLVQALKADALRPRKERRTGLALYREIQAAGYTGGYSRVTDFIRAWRQDGGGTPAAFVPLTFEPGEAFQFDWSEEGVIVGGIYYKAQVAHLKLCASRAFWLVAYPGQGHEMLFDAHTRGFAALGGVPRRGIYDNMKTAVDRVPGRGKARVVNARFAAFVLPVRPGLLQRGLGLGEGPR